jgi:sugar phosphate permease
VKAGKDKARNDEPLNPNDNQGTMAKLPYCLTLKKHTMTQRSSSWKWWITGLLLLATTINYMDRVTLANASVRVTQEFGLSEQQYGNLELAFGWAFALGSLLFGFMADRFRI